MQSSDQQKPEFESDEEEVAPFRRYYTPKEVAQHNHDMDCWVSWLGKVYNLTSLLSQFEEDEAIKPLVLAAGKDISDWFNEATGELKTIKHPITGLETPWTPYGRVVHVPPYGPASDFRNDFGPPWWKDSSYCIGSLTKKTRKVRIVNMLSHQEHMIEVLHFSEVCSEETINEIKQRYLPYNDSIERYEWKHMGRPLDMEKTLEENGIPDESQLFEELSINEDSYYPALHIHFKD